MIIKFNFHLDEIANTIVPLAKANQERIEFLEFKNALDYQKELIEPIRLHIQSLREKESLYSE